MERTFAEDITDRDELRNYLFTFCEEVAFYLRDKGLRGKTLTLKARFSDFKTVTRTKTLEFPTNLGPRLYATSRELLERVQTRPLRLLGIQISRLEDVRQPNQGTLFNGSMAEPSTRRDLMKQQEKLAQVTPSLDKLRKKFGRGTVVPASLLNKKPPAGRDGTE
jgi:DNA polymerase-4